MKNRILSLLFVTVLATGCVTGFHAPTKHTTIVSACDTNEDTLYGIAINIRYSQHPMKRNDQDTLLMPQGDTVLVAQCYFGGISPLDSTKWQLHSAIMDFYDSFEAAKIGRTDSIVLNLDSLTLVARSGNPEAQRQLTARHAIEGDINGMWASDALMVRDDSMRTELAVTRARIARSDSAKAALDRLRKP